MKDVGGALRTILDIITNHLDIMLNNELEQVIVMFEYAKEIKQQDDLSVEDMATLDKILEMEPIVEKHLKLKAFW